MKGPRERMEGRKGRMMMQILSGSVGVNEIRAE